MSYTQPHQFEPLLPHKQRDILLTLAHQTVASTCSLHKAMHPTTAKTLAYLLRAMNSYYSNKIEGQSTHPLHIERSLHKNFSTQPGIARLQRLALAHIQAEQAIEAWVMQDSSFSPLSADGIQRIHAALYERLPEEERLSADGHRIIPGAWRKTDVSVGQHIPPTHTSLQAFLQRYQQTYEQANNPAQQLLHIAAAHHRLAWIHPFLDGNGRVTRLASHAALYKTFTSGLWSICRGLARTQNQYYVNLAYADQPRQGDLDGRGNLSEMGLAHFCHYFLETCLDQANFMQNLLDMDHIRHRIRALLIFRATSDKQIRPEAELPLHYLFTSGTLTRAEFKQMTGLGDKVAQNLLSRLLKTGLVETDSPLGPVRFGMPLDALQFYFPNLYPEAAMRLEETG